MTKYCLEGNKSILVHALLLVDFVLALSFLARPSSYWVKLATFCLLDMNLFFICLLSFYYYTGMDPTFTVQGIGVAFGFLVGGVHARAIAVSGGSLLIDLILTSLLLVSAQLTNTYIPKLLNARFGISVTTASAFILLLPVGLFYVIRVVAKSETMAIISHCLAISFLVTLGYSVYTYTPDPRSDICCDFEASCPLHFTLSDVLVFVLLFTTFISVYFSEWLHNHFMPQEKFSFWWCCRICTRTRCSCFSHRGYVECADSDEACMEGTQQQQPQPQPRNAAMSITLDKNKTVSQYNKQSNFAPSGKGS